VPGKRYNYHITSGALRGLRARVLIMTPTTATVQVKDLDGSYGLNPDFLKRIKQKSTRPNRARGKKGTRK
jgi:hypothetical protein